LGFHGEVFPCISDLKTKAFSGLTSYHPRLEMTLNFFPGFGRYPNSKSTEVVVVFFRSVWAPKKTVASHLVATRSLKTWDLFQKGNTTSQNTNCSKDRGTSFVVSPSRTGAEGAPGQDSMMEASKRR